MYTESKAVSPRRHIIIDIVYDNLSLNLYLTIQYSSPAHGSSSLQPPKMDYHLTEYIMKHLKTKQISAAVRAHGLHFATRLTNNKTLFVHAIMDAGRTDILLDAVEDDLVRRDNLESGRRVRRRVDNIAVSTDPHNTSSFLEVPSPDELRSLYRRFYEATSNDALAHHTCAVCGRKRMRSEEDTRMFRLAELPRKESLHPPPDWRGDTSDLVEGMLLVKEGCRSLEGSDEKEVEVCIECLTELSKKHLADGVPPPPKYSLANGLWYGEVPWQLRCLTLPERLLIGLIYPRAYTVKLFPKAGGYDPQTLQTAIRGNITCFELNPDRIADMIQGRIMPQLPSILASLISITFVGMKKLPSTLR